MIYCVKGACYQPSEVLEQAIVPALAPDKIVDRFPSADELTQVHHVIGCGLCWDERQKLREAKVPWLHLRVAPPRLSDDYWLLSGTIPLPPGNIELPLPKPAWRWIPSGPPPIAVLALPGEPSAHRISGGHRVTLNELTARLEEIVPLYSRVVLPPAAGLEWSTSLALQRFMIEPVVPGLEVLIHSPAITTIYSFDPDLAHLAKRAGKAWEPLLHPAEESKVYTARELVRAAKELASCL